MDKHDFIGHVKANDIYINIVEDVEKRFDTSKHERMMKQQTVKIKKIKYEILIKVHMLFHKYFFF